MSCTSSMNAGRSTGGTGLLERPCSTPERIPGRRKTGGAAPPGDPEDPVDPWDGGEWWRGDDDEDRLTPDARPIELPVEPASRATRVAAAGLAIALTAAGISLVLAAYMTL